MGDPIHSFGKGVLAMIAPESFELNVGERWESTFGGTNRICVELINVIHVMEPNYSSGVAYPVPLKSEVLIVVDGERKTVVCAPFQRPVVINGIQIMAELTKPFAGGKVPVWLEKDVRFSAKTASVPWFEGLSLQFPITDYRWMSSSYYHTWNGFVHTTIDGNYYHRGEDFGAYTDRHDVVSPESGELTVYHPQGDGVSNTFAIRSNHFLYRFVHCNTPFLRQDLHVSDRLHAGERIAKSGNLWLGKPTQSPHLHFEARSLTDWITPVNTWPMTVHAYQQAYPEEPMAVAGGFRFCHVGDTLVLDGSLSVGSQGCQVSSYRWVFADGDTAEGSHVSRIYPASGTFSEELTIVDVKGYTSRSYVIVKVFNEQLDNLPFAHINYYPHRNICPGDPVHFLLTITPMKDAVIDFGDGHHMPVNRTASYQSAPVCPTNMFCLNNVTTASFANCSAAE
jgi:murein DD-endopeptidase MepM/ murein hydrolase activator NlpD